MDIEYPNGDDFVYSVDGFRFLGITTMLLLIICIVLNLGIFFETVILALIFVFIPALYKIMQPISRFLLKIVSSPKSDILDLLPMVNFKGKWFMELDSERVQMKNIKDVMRFVWDKKTDFFIIAPGINLLIIQVFYYLGLFDLDPARGNLEENIIKSDFLLYSFFIPFIFIIYISIVYPWESAEIKFGKINTETAIHRKNQFDDEFEVNELRFASSSLRNFIVFFTGINVINWAAKVDQILNQGSNFWSNFMVYYILFLVMSTGYSIFLGVMYFRSKTHSQIVNNLRQKIWNDYTKSKAIPNYKRKYHIDVRRSAINKVIAQPTQNTSAPVNYQLSNYNTTRQISSTRPNFCTTCGFKVETQTQKFCKGCGTKLV